MDPPLNFLRPLIGEAHRPWHTSNLFKSTLLALRHCSPESGDSVYHSLRTIQQLLNASVKEDRKN
jgi:hypothetical protein